MKNQINKSDQNNEPKDSFKKNSNYLVEQLLDVIPFVMTQIRSEYRNNRGTELTITHFRLLANIWKGPLTNKELAEIIGLSIPAMSRCVQTLEKRGLLKKTPRSNDRREFEIALTSKGLNLFESIRKKVIESVKMRISSLITAEKQSLSEGLNVLIKAFQIE